MCLIIASPTGKRISDKILEEAAQSNRDGCGIAWLFDKKIHYRKGLVVADIKRLLDSDAKDKPWVAHFRIATHGGVKPELTHPFSIDEHASVALEGDSDTVLFHNGTFPEWKNYLLQAAASSGTPLPEAPWSDTRALAFCCGIYGKHLLSVIDNHSRFLVFDATVPEGERMMLWGSWETFECFKFSNRGTSAFYSNSGHGGGSSNFTNRREMHPPVDEENENASTEISANSNSVQTSPNDNSQQSLTSKDAAKPAASTATKPSRSFKPKPNHDYWSHFSPAGLHIVADNEVTAHTA